ncbi:acyl-CoA N-acyltransferase, partial [Obelidium mucronatum]
MIIIQATPGHWSVLSALAKQTFTDTFGHLYAPEDLEAHLSTKYTEAVLTLEIQTELVYLVCQDDDTEGTSPFGFCQLKPDSRNDLMPDISEYPDPCWEIHRFYLKKEMQGVRAGSTLMNFAMGKLKEAGAKSIWLSVWSENFKAQRFYEKFGICHSGKTMTYMVGNHADLEFLYTA